MFAVPFLFLFGNVCCQDFEISKVGPETFGSSFHCKDIFRLDQYFEIAEFGARIMKWFDVAEILYIKSQ